MLIFRAGRGVSKGDRVVLVQFANDWMTADSVPDGRPLVLNPLSVELEDQAEVDWVKAEQNTGNFWRHYELDEETRRFRRRSVRG